MREIKFRAWDKRNNVLFSVNEIKFSPSAGLPLFISDDTRKKAFLPSWCELMQYTGLHDKNGKEIYEGDIVKWGNVNWGVVWNDDGFGFYLNGINLEHGYSLGEYSEYSSDIEIIGNIYENPELLK